MLQGKYIRIVFTDVVFWFPVKAPVRVPQKTESRPEFLTISLKDLLHNTTGDEPLGSRDLLSFSDKEFDYDRTVYNTLFHWGEERILNLSASCGLERCSDI